MQTQALAIGLTMGLGAIGGGLAIGIGSAQAYAALGRNPEAAAVIRNNFILGLVFSETVAIYALLISFLLLFHQF